MINKSGDKTTESLENWEGELKTLVHKWVVQLIKFGEAKIPEHGFYVFDCPDLVPFVEKLLATHASEVRKTDREKIKKAILKITDKGFDCICSGYIRDYFNKLR